MTRRERLEARAERRREWAASRERKAANAAGSAESIAQRFEGGQPILVGHHSEGRARRDQERMHSAMSASVESRQMAEHHESKAAGIERQLERSIFDDDPDALEQLEARCVENERTAALYLAINDAWRLAKGERAGLVVALARIEAIGPGGAEKVADTALRTMSLAPWLGVPMLTTNVRAAIRRDRQRLDRLRQERAKANEREGQP